MWILFEPDQSLNYSIMQWTKTRFNPDSLNSLQMPAVQQKPKAIVFSLLRKKNQSVLFLFVALTFLSGSLLMFFKH